MSEWITTHELVSVLWKEFLHRRVLIAALFAAAALAGPIVGSLVSHRYAASTSILVQESNIIKPLMEGRAVTTGVADHIAIAREVIFSRKIMDEVLVAGGWMAQKPTPVEQERIIENIKSRTVITSLRENLIQIAYTDSDPQRTYMVTTRLASLFIQESLAAKERESREAYNFIDSQVDGYRKKLTDAEDKLKAYRGKNADARPGSSTDANTRIAELRTQMENSRMDLMEQRSKEGALVSQLSGESEMTAVQTRDGQYRSRLGDLQGELDKLLLTDTDQHPDVVRVRHQMQDLQEQMQREQQRHQQQKNSGTPSAVDDTAQYNPLFLELRSKLAEVRRNSAAAQSRMGAGGALLQSELDRSGRIADTEAALSELTRDYEVNRDIYQDMLKRRENARVSMNIDADHRGLSFTIQEPALLPLRPSGLRMLHFELAGLGFGIALPLALLFGFVRLDPRVRSTDQLARHTGLPVLATIPIYPSAESRRRNHLRSVIFILIIAAVAMAYAFILILQLKSAL